MKKQQSPELGNKLGEYRYNLLARHRFLVLGFAIFLIFSVGPIVMNVFTSKSKTQDGAMYGIFESEYNTTTSSVRIIFLVFMGLVLLADFKDRKYYPKIIIREKGISIEGNEIKKFLWNDIEYIEEFGFQSGEKLGLEIKKSGGPGCKIIKKNGESFVILSTLTGYSELKKQIENRLRT